MPLPPYICPKCGHKWAYMGTSTGYITCPACYRKVQWKNAKPKVL